MIKSKCGTFEHCSKCKLKVNCCCDFGTIDAPVISEIEREKLKEIYSINDFCTNCGERIYSLNLNGDKCIFYNNGCTIYNNRPLDCRLFPFDLKKIDGRYYLVLYNLKCLEGINFISENYCLDDVIDAIKPWIESYTDDSICSKLDAIGYTIIKEIIV